MMPRTHIAICLVLVVGQASGLSLPWTMKTEMFKSKQCPFKVPSDNVVFNNKPSLPLKILIKSSHFAQRKLIQAGGLYSDNFLVSKLSKAVSTIDVVWLKADPEFFLKRREIFGDNYCAFAGVNIGKYSSEFEGKDTVDARLVTYPQAKLLHIGAFACNPDASFWYGPKGEKGYGWNLVPLFISDRGTTENPLVEPNGPDHTDMRDFLMDNFVGESHMEAAIARQTDEIGSKLLKEYGEDAKGKEGEELKNALLRFMPKFMMYCLFDVPLEKIPMEAIDGLQGGIAQQSFFLGQLTSPFGKIDPKMVENTSIFMEFIEKESKVLKSFTPGPKGLGITELCGAIPMVFVTAAFLGTRDLSFRPMDQTPKGYLESVADDDSKLRNAILETARLDTPVPFSSQAVDDDEGLTTQIGKRTFTFKKGTPTCSVFTQANIDENRFPNPYVFDPESRDFSKLTSFNSVGESTQEASAHICPGREFAINAAMNIIRTKINAEKN